MTLPSHEKPRLSNSAAFLLDALFAKQKKKTSCPEQLAANAQESWPKPLFSNIWLTFSRISWRWFLGGGENQLAGQADPLCVAAKVSFP